MDHNKPDNYRADHVSQRRFRRSNRVKDMRKKQARADDNFFRAVFSLAGVATAFVFILIWAAMSGGGGLVALAPLSEPWIGPFSMLEVIGFGVIAFLAAIYLWRIRRR